MSASALKRISDDQGTQKSPRVRQQRPISLDDVWLERLLAGDRAAQAELFRRHRPDVTLMDMQMPEMNGIDSMMAICEEFPSARIIVLTTYLGDALVLRALKEPVRDRKTTKNIKHDGNITLDQVIEVARTMRPRSLARTLSSIRAFHRFLERRKKLKNAAVMNVAAPKQPKTLPRPLRAEDALQTLEEAGATGRGQAAQLPRRVLRKFLDHHER